MKRIIKLMEQITIPIGKVNVPIHRKDYVNPEHFEKALKCQKFNNWVQKLNTSEVEVRSITFLLIFMFGPNVGFINVDVDAYYKGKRLPGFVFIRGDAVAMLLLLNGKLVLTRQFRTPFGNFLLEAPAGMVDEEKNFTGVAAKELKEECGVDITQSDMDYLGELNLSPGGMDEVLYLYSVEKQVSEEKMNEILNKVHGSESEGEHITLEIVDFTWENVLKTKDSKLIALAGYYFEKKKQS